MSAFSGCLMAGNEKLFQEHWLSLAETSPLGAFWKDWIQLFSSNRQFLFRHPFSAWDDGSALSSMHCAALHLPIPGLSLRDFKWMGIFPSSLEQTQSIQSRVSMASSCLPGLGHQFIDANVMSSTPRLIYFMQESQQRFLFTSEDWIQVQPLD